MRIILKNTPRLQLADLLKRRKMTLLQFVTEHAITTYEGLCARCEWMGVSPPTDEQYKVGVPSQAIVNNPQEGIIVVEAPIVIDEMSGRSIDPEAPVVPGISVVTDKKPSEHVAVHIADPPKRSRKKKDVPPVA